MVILDITRGFVNCEHHTLKLSFVDGVETEFVLRVENGPKNCSGSYKDKGVCSAPSLAIGNYFYVYLFNLYLSKLLNTTFEEDVFYL